MKLSVVAAALVAAIGFATVSMPVAAKELTAQQMRMKACNASAKEQTLKGDPRKDFMKTCLKKDSPMPTLSGAAPAAAAPAATPAKADQKEKMKACNATAKEKALKGDDRKTFMKTCLTAG